ncbi:hypothetical protein LLY41_21535 [Cytobacillus firmus]|uniref:hypothetical protein n=1 Tax=Cytobacillus firmus TaxID=1399 RepID=UPI002184E236|nr:hypothetical protein [Cytobacillus firmus]URM32836.1 hypothetical protein LLY41_21535 [Cytobacillus firmus]
MEQDQKISVSTQDLIAVLAQSESVKRAREFAYENNLSKKEIGQINETQPESNISNSLKEMVNTALNASKMIRIENGNQYLLVYRAHKTGGIVEYIHNDLYEFKKYDSLTMLNNLISDFYGLDSRLTEDPIKVNIELTNDLYDQIHYMDPAELEKMIDDEKFDVKIRQFLRDFYQNNQQVCKLVFKKRRTIKNPLQEDFVMLFVPGEDYIWHINYEESSNNRIFLMSNSINNYFDVLQRILDDFLHIEGFLAEKKPRKAEQEVEGFSFKRGFSFFWKSNFVLLITVLFLYINKSGWSEGSGPMVVGFAVFCEVMIILLSIFACLKEREEPFTVKRAKSAS